MRDSKHSSSCIDYEEEEEEEKHLNFVQNGMKTEFFIIKLFIE